MEESKYLRLAREARAENNSESAKMYYQKVREEDPENGEAKFFYAYYSLHESTNGELPGKFVDLCNGVNSSIGLVKNSQQPKAEQLKMVEAIVNAFVPETWANYKYMNRKNHEQKVGDQYVQVFSWSDIIRCAKNGMRSTRDLGDEIVKLYPGDPEAKRLAAVAWKEYVSLAQKERDYAPEDDAEIYAAKVKEVDPSYEMPKKAGSLHY